ncbi:hypothetical protein BHE74_00018905, partial [Ensete ventricosum]
PSSQRSGCAVRILLSSVRFASSSFSSSVPNIRRLLLYVAFLTEIEGGGGVDWATGRRQISYCLFDGAAASRENPISRSRGWVTGRATRSIRVARMSTPARKRLMRDFKRLQQDPPAGISGAPHDNNIMLWNAVIFGYVWKESFLVPDDTPWDGGRFSGTVVYA